MGFVLSVLAKVLKLPFVKGPILFYKGLKKYGLYSWAIFAVFVLPGLIGSYSFLRSQGLEPVFAVPAAFGVEFGGLLSNIVHGFQQMQGAGVVASLIILGGMMSSAANLIWGAIVWVKVNKLVEGQNLSKLYITATGFLFLFFAVSLTLFIDQYVLEEGTRRLAGMTYVLSSPGEALSPMLDVLQSWSSTPETGNATTTLKNISEVNSTMGG